MKKGKGQGGLSLQNLKNDFSKIEKELKDTKYDWKKRSEALKKCQDILNSDYSDEPYFANAFEQLADCISTQLTDLRSGIVKQASHLIADAAELLGEGIEGFGEKVLIGGKVLKQIKSGNKVVSELAHGCVLSILQNSVMSKSIPTIVGEVNSKNGAVRAKVSEYMSIMLDNYPDEVLERHLDVISKGVKKTLGDANPQARDHARTSLNLISERFPFEAKKIFDKLDATTKKQLSLTNEPSGSQYARGNTPPRSKTRPTPKKSKPKVKKPKPARSRPRTTHNEEDFEDEFSEDMDNMDSEEYNENDRSHISSKNGRARRSNASTSQSGRAKSRIDSGLNRNKSRVRRNNTSPDRTKKIPNRGNKTAKFKRNPKGSRTGTAGRKIKSASRIDSKNLYGDSKIEELQDLVHELSDDNWAVRANNFKDISELLQECEEDESVTIPDSFKKTLFKNIIKKFNDIHIKVQVASLKTLNENFNLFSKFIGSKSSEIIQKIIECLAESKDNVRQLGGNLLSKFTKEFTEREVLDLIIKIIHSFDKVKAQLKALELMDQIIGMIRPEDYVNSIVKTVVNKSVYIFKDKMRDKDFTKTILSILTKSFEKNNEQSNEYFCLLSPSLQNKVIEFAEKNDPDFLMVFEQQYMDDYEEVQPDRENEIEEYHEEDEYQNVRQSQSKQSNRMSRPQSRQQQEEIAGYEDEYDEYQEEYKNFNEGRGLRQSQMRERKEIGNYDSDNVRGSRNRGALAESNGGRYKNVQKSENYGMNGKNSRKRSGDSNGQEISKHKENRGPAKKTRKIDLNVDLIDPSDIQQIAKTLELLAKKLNQLKSNNKMMELKNLLIMAFPYMVRVLSFEIEDVHNFCFDLIQSTYSFFNLCNDAYSLVLNNLLDLFDSNHGDIDLLHEAADLIIFFPFRQELMKQILEKLEVAVSPSLQLYLKLMVSILSAANGGEIDLNDFRKGFIPILGRLVFYLTKHINNPNPEVRKGVVFILVELHFFLDEDDFMNIMSTFNNSQQKLVFIYVQKKLKKYSN